jgi:DNA-directed RNA polymerase subunit H (RpoH/RPB5)
MDSLSTEELRAYANLGPYLASRNYVVTGEPLRPKHVEDKGYAAGQVPAEIVGGVITKIGTWEVVARSTRDPAKVLVIFLVTKDGKAAHGSKDLMILLARAAQRVEEGQRLYEVIILAPEDTTKMANLANTVRNFAKSGKGAAGAAYIMYPYCKFITDITKRPTVPKHEIIPKAEAEEFLAKYHLVAAQLPRIITSTDPAAIWVGARPGDYVRVYAKSETAGTLVPEIRYGV